MNEHPNTETFRAETESQPKPEGGERLQSTVQFPYSDMDSGIEVVRALIGLGGGPASPDQVAAAMGQVPTSGNFRLKIAAARIFGLISTAPKRIELTDLAYEIADQSSEATARARAFLNVELYQKVFEEFQGKTLPPRPKPFERMLERMGVSPKQVDKARHALDRSAQQAGFYAYGRERMVMPSAGASTAQSAPVNDKLEKTEKPSVGGGNGGGSGLDPLILGLLSRLPDTEKEWPAVDRVRWLRALALNLSLIYGADGDIEISEKSPPQYRKSVDD